LSCHKSPAQKAIFPIKNLIQKKKGQTTKSFTPPNKKNNEEKTKFENQYPDHFDISSAFEQTGELRTVHTERKITHKAKMEMGLQ